MSLYFVCTSPRTGGTLFCSTLSQTKQLATPGSYIYAHPSNVFLSKFSDEEFESYLKTVPNRLHQETEITKKYSKDLYWLYETNLFHDLGNPIDRLRYFYEHLKSDNILTYLEKIRTSTYGGDNWGIKILSNDNTYEGGFNYLIQHLRKSLPHSSKKSRLQLLQEIDGDIKFIWLTRRNKVRQALSYWKAVYTKKWHHYKNDTSNKNKENPLPTKEQLNEYVIQLSLDDAHWEDFFTENKIIPHTVVYEDFILNPEQTIRDIFNYLKIEKAQEKYPYDFNELKMAQENSNAFLKNYYKDSFIW